MKTYILRTPKAVEPQNRKPHCRPHPRPHDSPLSAPVKVSGGRILYVGLEVHNDSIAVLAAQSLWHAQNYFGDLYRRWKARLGGPKAITAMAHKLARILWHLLKYKEACNPEVFAQAEQKMKRQKLARLQTLAAALNYRLVPNQ